MASTASAQGTNRHKERAISGLNGHSTELATFCFANHRPQNSEGIWSWQTPDYGGPILSVMFRHSTLSVSFSRKRFAQERTPVLRMKLKLDWVPATTTKWARSSWQNDRVSCHYHSCRTTSHFEIAIEPGLHVASTCFSNALI